MFETDFCHISGSVIEVYQYSVWYPFHLRYDYMLGIRGEKVVCLNVEQQDGKIMYIVVLVEVSKLY